MKPRTLIENHIKTVGDELSLEYVADFDSLKYCEFDEYTIKWIKDNWNEPILSKQTFDHDYYDDEEGDDYEVESITGYGLTAGDGDIILIIGMFSDGMHREPTASIYPKAIGFERALQKFLRSLVSDTEDY